MTKHKIRATYRGAPIPDKHMILDQPELIAWMEGVDAAIAVSEAEKASEAGHGQDRRELSEDALTSAEAKSELRAYGDREGHTWYEVVPAGFLCGATRDLAEDEYWTVPGAVSWSLERIAEVWGPLYRVVGE